jgi:hypothetical protein
MIDRPNPPQQMPLSKVDELEIEIHLKEYEALSASIRVNIERLDRIIGLYSAAISAIIAFFLTRTDVATFLGSIDGRPDLTTLVLVIPAINCILLIHTVSTFQVILVQARCSTYVLGERLRTLMQRDVLLFDQIDDLDKRAWLKQRSFIGIVFCVLSLAVSLSILFRFTGVLGLSGALAPKLTWVTSCIVVSVSLGHLARHGFVNRYFAVLHRKDGKEPVKLWLISTVFFVILFLCAVL